MTKEKDDIDDDHDLRTKEKYVKRMKHEDKRSTCPCVECPSREHCTLQGRCQDFRDWSKRYIKNKTH